MENKEVIFGRASTVKTKKSKHTPSRIQADTLFTFTTELDHIIPTIKERIISPRYCEEDIRYLKIPKLKKIAYPMKCFCDINLHRLEEHLEWYGYYGLAFEKEWGMAHKIQPIQYINIESDLRKDFTEAFSAALKVDTKKESRTQLKMKSFLLHEMMYYKPYEGKFKNRNTGKIVKKCFTDECEWRFIPDVTKAGYEQVYFDKNILNAGNLSEISNSMFGIRGISLEFEYADLKYIIVKSIDDFDILVREIESMSLNKLEAYNLYFQNYDLGCFKGGFLMFVDFNKVFKNKNQTELTVPKAVVDYMNQSLPEGVKYVAQEDGTCIVTSTTESLTIGGFTFEPTEEQKKILGKNYTQEDVLEYFYNVQQRIPLKLEKEGYILLNGKEFPVEKMAYNPLIPIKYVSGSFCMFPPKFPDPFHITVGCEKYKRVLLVSRIPNNSVSTGEYESNKEEPLYIHYLIDDKKKSFTLNISYSLAKAKHIRDIVESTSIYNAFLDGTGILLGKNLRGKVKEKDVKGFNPKSIAFWEKVLRIEEYLNVNFIPPDRNVDTETQYLVEQLYQNLINEIPTRYNQRLNSVEGKWKFDNEKNKSLDGSIYFEFESEITTELFGVKLHLFALTGIFNTSIDIQEINGEKQKIIFHDESNEKKQFSSIICFKSEKELKEYKKKDHNKIVELFREAKRPYEYL